MTTATTTHIEAIYEALAEAIDRAGPEYETVFLTRLALTLGAKLDDPRVFHDAIRIALTGSAATSSG